MTARSTHTKLAKLLAAAAWADGRLDQGEVTAIKQFMLRLKLDADDAKEVTVLLANPVPRSEAEALTTSFLESVGSEADKRLLLEELEALAQVDGKVRDEEAAFLRTVREMVETHSVVDLVLERVKGLFSWGGSRRTGRRDSDLAEMLRNRVQDRVRERLTALSAEAAEDAMRLNRAALFGALLHKIAYADGVLAAEESERVGSVLATTFGYADDEIATIRATLEEEVGDGSDLQRLCAEFARVSEESERINLIRALFLVAAADHQVSPEEVEEIRRIADFLWVHRREFNDIRLAFVKGEANGI